MVTTGTYCVVESESSNAELYATDFEWGHFSVACCGKVNNFIKFVAIANIAVGKNITPDKQMDIFLQNIANSFKDCNNLSILIIGGSISN